MDKRWIYSIFAVIVVLAVGIIAFNSDRFANDFSGMSVKVTDYCVSSCSTMSKFWYKQGASLNSADTYTISEGDYFMVSLNDLTRSIEAVYRYDGLLLNNPNILPTAPQNTDTGNYVKLSLIYAKVHSLTVIDDDTLVKGFNCNGNSILVPIVNPGYVGKALRKSGSVDSSGGLYFANVQIKPFENAGVSQFYYSTSGKQLPDFVNAAVLIRGNNPVGVSTKILNLRSSLLVDLDGDGQVGGDLTSVSYEATGICSKNIYDANKPWLKSTSYRGSASDYQ